METISLLIFHWHKIPEDNTIGWRIQILDKNAQRRRCTIRVNEPYYLNLSERQNTMDMNKIILDEDYRYLSILEIQFTGTKPNRPFILLI